MGLIYTGWALYDMFVPFSNPKAVHLKSVIGKISGPTSGIRKILLDGNLTSKLANQVFLGPILRDPTETLKSCKISIHLFTYLTQKETLSAYESLY